MCQGFFVIMVIWVCLVSMPGVQFLKDHGFFLLSATCLLANCNHWKLLYNYHSFFLSFSTLFFYSVCMYVSVCTDMDAHTNICRGACVEVRGQILGVLTSNMWGLGIELRLSG